MNQKIRRLYLKLKFDLSNPYYYLGHLRDIENNILLIVSDYN